MQAHTNNSNIWNYLIVCKQLTLKGWYAIKTFKFLVH